MAGNVGQEREAYDASLVPVVHRVDPFRELRPVQLVNADSIYPSPMNTSLLCETAAFDNLFVPGRVFLNPSPEILEGHFVLVISPCVRQYSIPGNFVWILEGAQLQICSIDKTHVFCSMS